MDIVTGICLITLFVGGFYQNDLNKQTAVKLKQVEEQIISLEKTNKQTLELIKKQRDTIIIKGDLKRD